MNSCFRQITMGLTLLLLLTCCQKESVELCEAEDLCNLTAYPNPATDAVSISFLSDVAANAELLLFNLNGRTLINRPLQIHRGENKEVMDLETMNSGIYLISLRVEETEDRYRLKVVKQ